MSSHKIGIALLAAVTIAACESPATSAPRIAASDAASLQNDRGIIAAASGDGQAELPPGFGPIVFSYGANQHFVNGGLGTFRQSRTRNGLLIDFTARVTCVTNDAANHRAWVGGVVTENNSTDPNFQTAIHQVGQDVWFRVVDNGEGANATADRTTTLGFAGAAGFPTSAAYCAGKPWAAGDANTWPVVDGNIQVRP
jgi:hypothetical protein